EVASADEFFRAPKHPYAQALLRALPDADRRGVSLAAIGGTVPALTQTFTGCRFAPRCASVMAHCASTLPSLDATSPTRSVRCLLYTNPAPTVRPEPVEGPASTPGLRQAQPERDGAMLLEVKNLRVRFPIRQGLLQRTAGYFDAVDGVSYGIRA